MVQIHFTICLYHINYLSVIKKFKCSFQNYLNNHFWMNNLIQLGFADHYYCLFVLFFKIVTATLCLLKTLLTIFLFSADYFNDNMFLTIYYDLFKIIVKNVTKTHNLEQVFNYFMQKI